MDKYRDAFNWLGVPIILRRPHNSQGEPRRKRHGSMVSGWHTHQRCQGWPKAIRNADRGP